MSIKSPYNFVPAPSEKEVFKPDWADKVSHDIPFSDGESGEIELKITSMTPIFIRNGHKKDDQTNEFSHYVNENGEKKYFIPGSSLKGMFRNVLEIMSFSRMSQVDSDKIFALRDMNNKKFSNNEIRNTKTGWLRKKDDRWVIYNCRVDRVDMDSIASKFNVVNFKDLSAKEKYERCGIRGFDKVFDFEYVKEVKMTGKIYNIVNKQSDLSGYLVMFGSMQNKKYEYVFQRPNFKEPYYELYSQDLYDRILDIESELDQSLWRYFKDLKINSIPVFYKLDSQGKKVIHFGFSKIYKLNNTHYLKELEPLKSYFQEEKQRQKDDLKYDLAQLIFGHTSDGDALKGRVMIGHAISKNAVPQANHEERVLGSPKPSFYPAYLLQSENIDQKNVHYKTYLDSHAELKGFKKYPLHNTIKPNTNIDNENIASEFTPIQSGAIFCGKIRYHNLRKVELGALISAITFHNCQNSFHNIGSVKPYGYGKIKVEIKNTNVNISEALAYFEYAMDLHAQNKLNKAKWLQTMTMIELSSLSQSSNNNVNSRLCYPKLEDENERKNQRKNQFNNVKKDNQSLKYFSELNGVPNLKSLLTDDFMKKIVEEKRLSNQKVKEAKLQQQRLIEQQKLELQAKKKEFKNLISQARTLYQNNDNKSALSLIEQAEALGLDNVSHLDLKQDVLKAIEIQKKQEELEVLKQQEEVKRKAETEAKLASGLAAYLEEKNLKDEYIVRNFKMIKAKTEKYLKDSANEKLPENELIVLEQCVKRVFNSLNTRDQKEWQKFENNKIWNAIETWTNGDFAKSIYDKLF